MKKFGWQKGFLISSSAPFIFSVFTLFIFTPVSGAYLTAQPGPGPMMPPLMGGWKPVVGKGALYKVEPEGEDAFTMQVAVVGKEKNGYWMENVMEVEGEEMIHKTLVTQQGPRRMIMQMPGQPPMEMPMQGMGQGMHRGSPHRMDVEKRGKLIGNETIKTPAGSFECKHYQVADQNGTSDVWIHPGVSPYGLVKMKSGRMEMILQKVLTGVTSKITGTPRKFTMPHGGGMMPGMPHGRPGME